MTPDVFNDADAVVARCPISPGCPTADAVLDGYSERSKLSSPLPLAPQRTGFGNTEPPPPTRNPFATLHPGLFVLFQLDKRQLAHELLIPEASKLFERFLEFPTKRYVGLVLDHFDGPDTGEHLIAFVSKSLPPTPGSSLDPNSFAVPIVGPTVERENIPDRHLLKPRLFPWVGCYLYTVLGTRVAPMRIYASALKYELKGEDFEDFEAFAIDDRRTLERRSLSVSSTPDEEALLFERMKISDEMVLPVKVWQDLRAETSKECHDPREFVEEVSELLRSAVESLNDV